MLPYQYTIQCIIHSFGGMFDARLLSMPDRSTSELLRTLQMNGCFQANILAVKAIRLRQINLAYIWGPQLMVWVLSLSALDLSTQRLTPEYMSQHSEFVRIWQAVKPPSPISSSTSMTLLPRGCSQKHFGEYELSLSLISLSPLPTTHPKTFQRQLVRSSILCYQNFNLLKGRSLGFASTPTDYTPYSDSLSLRLRD
eukprot:TRINITY_DN1_c0_g1_i18.p2 TRINITY_DN1_c0_g1~~TRINITY_DN1_c0_g1_i18.p2  ORF type:complete len:197 (+),score=-36.80 TRINITY_DN1_c0_g1_i18:1449-2039(+)